MSLGLRDYKRQGRNLFYSLYFFKDELRYAFQRFWKGYDDRYLFSMDEKLDELIPEILTYLRYHRWGSPVLNESETCHEDWDKVLDEILYHFKECNEETCSEKNEFVNDTYELIDKDDSDGETKRFNRSMEIDEYQSKHRKAAYLLIAEYIGCFWD